MVALQLRVLQRDEIVSFHSTAIHSHLLLFTVLIFKWSDRQHL